MYNLDMWPDGIKVLLGRYTSSLPDYFAHRSWFALAELVRKIRGDQDRIVQSAGIVRL